MRRKRQNIIFKVSSISLRRISGTWSLSIGYFSHIVPASCMGFYTGGLSSQISRIQETLTFPIPPSELVVFEVSDLKLDHQEGAKASLGSERDRDGVRESRADKTLRKTRHPARKQVRPMAICTSYSCLHMDV